MEVKWRIRELPPYRMVCENQWIRCDYGGMEVFRDMHDFLCYHEGSEDLGV